MFSNMSHLLESINSCTQINCYAIRKAQKKLDSYAVRFPDEGANSFKDIVIDSLKAYEDETISENSIIKGLPLNNNKTYSFIISLISNAIPYYRNHEKFLKSDFMVIKLMNDDFSFLLVQKRVSTQLKTKQKRVFMAKEDQLELIMVDELKTINTEIDLIIDEKNNEIYSISGARGLESINYSDDQKVFVESKKEKIYSWSFISNVSYLLEKLSNKYVYENLYNALADENYLKQIQNSDPKSLKKNIMNTYPKLQDKSNFDKDNKIIISQKNIKYVMNIIGKGLKFNFFIGRVEDV